MAETDTQYGRGARALHWTMSTLIFLQLGLGFAAWEFMERGPARSQVVLTHLSVGMVLLGLIALRIAWRLRNPPPAPLPGQPAGMVKAAKAAHAALYGLMLALPITGWLTVSSGGGVGPSFFGLFRFPALWGKDEPFHEVLEVVHIGLAWALVLVVVVHVGAALYHHFGRKDGTLGRMLG